MPALMKLVATFFVCISSQILNVDSMFGRDRVSSLADQVQTGCMLRFNKRIVG